MDRAKREALKRIRVAFHKYTGAWYLNGGSDERAAFEDTYAANKNQPIPTYDEMKQEIFSKMLSERYRFVQVAPDKANCAVRIYRKELDVDGKPGGLCGAVCFVKNPSGKWTTITPNDQEFEMTYDETCPVEYWTSLITKYEKPVLADYYDVYLKVVVI